MTVPISRRSLVALAALAPAPLLAGCGGLLPKPPERQIYRLNPTTDRGDRVPQVGAQLLIATPSAPAGIDTKRIALVRSAVTLDYFADAEWTDRPPFLLKAAIIRAFERSRAFTGVSSDDLSLRGDFVLNIVLREFTAVYDSPDRPPRAKVQIEPEIVTMRGRDIVAETSLEREAAAAANDMAAIITAFNEAVGAVIGDLVTWTTTNPGLSRKRK